MPLLAATTGADNRFEARLLPNWSAAMKPTGPSLLICAALSIGLPRHASAQSRDVPFDDPLFRKCISWMLDGNRGALIDNLCIDNYAIPPPSIFLCARKVMTGFISAADQEGCALVFEEQARRARTGYVK
jgi:hypothetical protein